MNVAEILTSWILQNTDDIDVIEDIQSGLSNFIDETHIFDNLLM